MQDWDSNIIFTTKPLLPYVRSMHGHCNVTFGVLIDLAFVQRGALVAPEIRNITKVHVFELFKMHSMFVISNIVLIAMEVFPNDGLF